MSCPTSKPITKPARPSPWRCGTSACSCSTAIRNTSTCWNGSSTTGFWSGVALDGEHFFYPNPLACDGRTRFNHGTLGRAPWFGCSCCPVNVVRFLPSLSGYVYAARGRTIYVNLFVGDSGRVPLAEQTVSLSQATRYPWDGTVRLTVAPERAADFALRVRIPGWAIGKPVPSDLYRYAEPAAEAVTLSVNGQPVEPKIDQGYAVLDRRWSRGDTVELRLPMPIHRVLANENVAADRGRVALERGPIVYCAEAIDNGGGATHLTLPDDMRLEHEWNGDLLGGVEVVRAVAPSAAADDAAENRPRSLPFLTTPGHTAPWVRWRSGCRA